MSHRLLSCLFVAAALATTLSCKKIDDEEFKPKTTDLRVKIYDYYSYGPVQDVEVLIYHTRTNFFLRTGEIRKAMTNGAGEVLFEDLEPYNYFIYVRKLLDTTYYRSTSSTNEAYDIKYNIGEPLIENSLTTFRFTPYK
ncbi:MAG: hypothetical protein K2X86_08640 [Cytophagaceae bacterium]|nr:hypothetical protein [Cytophagaceae bacterium]